MNRLHNKKPWKQSIACLLLLSSALSVSAQEHMADHRPMLELIRDFDELAAEISQMHGELEQQNHAINQIKNRQRELYLDIDRRLKRLENRAPVPTVVSEPKNNPQTALPDNAEQLAYQTAFNTLKEGRYQTAQAELKRFLAQYPDSRYAGNAQYWLGEANYVSRNFDQSIIEFERVLSNYPESSKAADSMLKIGYTYYEKKQYDKAKIQLNALRKRYPETPAARLANKRLERIHQEGY